ncbi:MAG: dTDP-4-dehydrorhamnose reductase [Bacteroidota bacterium]
MSSTPTILVCGSNGQLGSELKQLEDQFPQYDFIFTDVDELDITERESLFTNLEVIKPDIIINCAAYTAVDKAETDIENAFLINADAPFFLAEYANHNHALLVHISTDYVFDGLKTSPYNETDAVNPQTEYGKSKLQGDEFIMDVINPDGVIIRTSWLYSSTGNNFVKTILRIAKEKDEIKVVDDQIGCPTWAADLALAVMKIIEQREKISGTHLYLYSNEGICSWFEFAKKIVEYANIDCKVIPIPTKDYPLPAPRPAYSVMSKDKIIKNFGLKIPHWEDSLKQMLQQLL